MSFFAGFGFFEFAPCGSWHEMCGIVYCINNGQITQVVAPKLISNTLYRHLFQSIHRHRNVLTSTRARPTDVNIPKLLTCNILCI